MSRRHILPGFRLTLGYTVFYLSLIVLLPLGALVWKSQQGGWESFANVFRDERIVDSLKISFGCSLVAALVNGVFGLLTAWVLERYRFPGRRIIEALVDLPFALPTAVAGIALVTIYAPNGMLGAWLVEHGINVAYTPVGITIALIFVGFPFVVRTVQPIIADLSKEQEEAAACLGATRAQTFRLVILPALIPPALAGMTLAFGRAVGEYGSVVFIAGNLPYKTEIAPLLITIKLEEYDYTGAAALGLVMLLASFSILILSHSFAAWNSRVKPI